MATVEGEHDPWSLPVLKPWHGWGPILVLPTVVLLFAPSDWPRWLFMWVLAFAIYVGCKWLTWRRTPVSGASWWRHAGYLLAWPGLDAKAFLRSKPLAAKQNPTVSEWGYAVLKLFLGAALFWLGSRLVPAGHPILLGWVGMVGIILMLHFGLFHLLSCGWRSIGVDARPLMNAPLLAVRVSEFWGKRWNTAFRDVTHRFLFRPLTGKLGPTWGILVGFFVSGVVHDLVISVPAGGGYGGPTLFFCLQGLALMVERSRPGRSIGLGRGGAGWLFTMLVLVLPVGMLFHPLFVEQVILPFMKLLGAA